MAELFVLKGPLKGKHFPVADRELFIGRHAQDISLHDEMVSRRHARLTRDGDGFVVEDMGSRNGTYVNDARAYRRRLQHGDTIQIGESLLEFRAPESPPEPPRAKHPGNVGELRNAIILDADEQELLHKAGGTLDTQALQRAREDLAAIHKAGRLLSSTLNTEQICERLLEIMFEQLPKADAVSIHVLETAENEPVCKGSRSRSGGPSAPFSSSMSKFVTRERKAVLMFDAMTDEQLKPTDSVISLNIRSVICVPLLSSNRMLGVLQAHTISAEHKFDRDDLRLLTMLGLQAGAALDNSALFERLASDKAHLQDANEKLKLAQDTLIRSEKLAAIGRLASGVVHDIKNPLTLILSHAELMQMSLQKASIRKAGNLNLLESLEEIQKGVELCNEVVNRLLAFTGQMRASVTLLDMNETVRSSLAFIAHELKKTNTEIVLNLAQTPLKVMADASQLKQVFLNIIINAIQAIKQKPGRIIISSKTSQENPHKAEISFSDNGEGMTEDVRRRLFEPFFTTKGAGEDMDDSGLSMAISLGIVQNLGGAMDVSSTPGSGSTFTVSLPLARR